MIIRKWATNSHELLQTIPENDRYPFEPLEGSSTTNSVTFIEPQDNSSVMTKETKCLGMSWDPKEDQLHYRSNEDIVEQKQPKFTKYKKISVDRTSTSRME